MQSFWAQWQHIPQHLEPVALEVGGNPIYWYALFFLFGSALVYWFAGRAYKREQVLTKQQFSDFAFGIFVSAILGGKLGFLLLYWWPFVSAKNTVLLPVKNSSNFALPGMSFIGGCIAVVLFLQWYARRYQKNFFTLADILALFLPLAIFWGRIGNFAHNELWGRVTSVPWGMYFPGGGVLRHPSTLYAAFLEGILLLSILFFLRKQDACKEIGQGLLTAWFCVLYGILRFFSESFREPDSQIGYIGVLTLNQIFAIGLLLVGVGIFSVKKKKNTV